MRIAMLTLVLLMTISGSQTFAGQFTVERYFEEKMGCKVIRSNDDYIISKGNRYLVLNTEELLIDGIKVNIAAPLIHNGYITQNLHDTMKRSAPSLSMYFDSTSKTFINEPYGKLEPVQSVIDLYPGEQFDLRFVDENGVTFKTSDLTEVNKPIGFITIENSLVTAYGYGQERLSYAYTRADKNFTAEVTVNVAMEVSNSSGNFINGAFVAGFDNGFYLHNNMGVLREDSIKYVEDKKIAKTYSFENPKFVNSVGLFKGDIQLVTNDKFKSFKRSINDDVSLKNELSKSVEKCIKVGDVYYYISEDDKHVYRYNPVTRKSFDLTGVKVSEFTLDNESIYFTNMEDGNALYKSNLLGPKLEKLAEGPVRSFDISKNLIYFTRNDNLLRMVDASGTVKGEITPEQTIYGKKLNVHNGAVYFINTSDDHLWRMSLDGRFVRQVENNHLISKFNTLRDYVVYITTDGEAYMKNVVNLDEATIKIQ